MDTLNARLFSFTSSWGASVKQQYAASRDETARSNPGGSSRQDTLPYLGVSAPTPNSAGNLACHLSTQVQAVITRHSMRHPFHKLPATVLSRIFLSLDLPDRLSFSRSMRHIRATVLRQPELWQNLCVAPDLNFIGNVIVSKSESAHVEQHPPSWNSIRPLIKRTAARPDLSRLFWIFEVLEDPTSLIAMQSILSTVLPTLTLLRLEPFGKQLVYHLEAEVEDDLASWIMGTLNYRQFNAIEDALRDPAPHLQSLQLSFWYDQYNQDRPRHLLSPDILGARSGQLRSCLIEGVELGPGWYPAFARLRVLDYCASYAWLQSDQLLGMLDGMPELEYLGLDCIGVEDNGSFPAIIEHPSLKGVSLRLQEGVLRPGESYRECWRAICASLDLIRRFYRTIRVVAQFREVYSAQMGPPLTRWSDLPASLQSPDRIHLIDELFFAEYQRPGTNLTLVITNRMDPHSANSVVDLLTEPMLDNLTELSIDGHLWPEVAPLPAPKLRRLTVYIIAYLHLWEDPSPFIASFEDPWCTPVLEELCFVRLPLPASPCQRPGGGSDRCTCTNGGTINLRDVYEFGTFNLDCQPLSTVAVRGFASLHTYSGDLEDALESLQILAERVDIDATIPEYARNMQKLYHRQYKGDTELEARWTPTNVFTDVVQATSVQWNCLVADPSPTYNELYIS